MPDSKQGIVYLLSNPAMPGIIKIGRTTRDTIEDRMRELFTTSVPVPFECEYACQVDDCGAVEKALHLAFEPDRVHPQREFFEIEPEQAIVILKLLKTDDVTSSLNDEINKSTSSIDRDAGENLKRRRRPRLNFVEMGIPVGSKLLFVKDETTEATVASEWKVLYKDEEYFLSNLTSELLHINHVYNPTRYWMYDGKILTDYYNAAYQMLD